MLIEWIPKLYVYLTGGQLIKRTSVVRAYQLMDCLRIITLVLFVGALVFNHMLFLIIAAPLAQSCNAISNIIFESLITYWWPAEHRITGHSQLMYLDLLAGVIIIPVIAYLDIYYIIGIGCATFSTSFILGYVTQYRHLSSITIKTSTDTLKYNLIELLKYKKLILMSCIGVSISTPIALVSSQLPFFLQTFDSGLASSTFMLAQVKAFISVVSIIFLYYLKYIKNMRILLNFSILMLLSALVGLFYSNNITVFLCFFLQGSLGFYGYLIFTKNYRQHLIPEHKRLEFTGILISMEAFSYIISAMCMIIFSSNLKYSILACIILVGLAGVLSQKLFSEVS